MYHILAFLIFLDIIITVIGVKYLGATELNPFCFDFTVFMIIKTLLSTVCIWTVYYYREDKYVHYAVVASSFIYVVVVINNLWCTVNYLYYQVFDCWCINLLEDWLQGAVWGSVAEGAIVPEIRDRGFAIRRVCIFCFVFNLFWYLYHRF